MDILDAATRETIEESGIEDVKAVLPDIFDVDIQHIAANPVKNEGEHLHYDIRYLLSTKTEHFTAPEGHEMKWFSVEELQSLDLSPEFRRMIRKWQEWMRAQSD